MQRIKEIEDSISNLPAGPEGDRERLELIAELAYRYVNVDIAKAREHAEELRRLAQAHKDQTALAKSYWVTAQCSFWQADYSASLADGRRAFKIFEELGDQAGLGNVLNVMGSALLKTGEHVQALIHHLRALKIGSALADDHLLSVVNNNLGSDYMAIADYGKALEHFQESLKIKQRSGDLLGEAAVLMNIGSIYEQMEEHETALKYHQLARKIFEKTGDARLSLCLNNIGGVYEKLNELQKSLDFFQKALRVARDHGYRQAEASVLTNIGVIFHKLGQDGRSEECFRQSLGLSQKIGERDNEAENLIYLGELLMDSKSYAECLAPLEKALALADKLQSPRLRSKALRLMAEINRKWDRPQEALDLFLRYMEEEKMLHQESLQKALYHVRVQQEVHKYLLEVESLKKQSQELARANKTLEALNRQLKEANQEKQFLIKSLEEHNKRLEGMITEDRQSGLYNLGAFREKLKYEMARAQRYGNTLSLAIFDIDNYEQTTSKLSKAKVEQVIVTLARIIKENIRMVDLAGHYNHRRFAIAFPETALKKASSVCLRIQKAVTYYDWRQIHPNIKFTMSFGIAQYDRGQDLELFFQAAEVKIGRPQGRERKGQKS